MGNGGRGLEERSKGKDDLVREVFEEKRVVGWCERDWKRFRNFLVFY